KGRRLYVPQLGRVRAFDIDSLTVARDTVFPGNCSAVAYDSATSTLLLSIRPDFTSPGWLTTINPVTGALLSTVRVGVNPGMVTTRLTETYAINEGVFGGASTISYRGYAPHVYLDPTSEAFGGGANYIATRGNLAYVVFNGTHQIRVLDTRYHTNHISPINTGTTGFDGPRTLDFQGDSVLVVGTYAGDIRRFNATTGKLIDSILMPGKAESIAVGDSLAYVAIPLDAAYKPDSLVVVVNLHTGKPVDTLVAGLNPFGLFVDRAGNLQVVVADTIPGAGRLVTYEHGSLLKKGERPLPGAMSFPLHMTYEDFGGAAGDSLFIVLSDTLFAFPVSGPAGPPRAVFIDSLAKGDLFGVSGGGDYLLVTERPKNFAADPCYVHVVERKSGALVAKFLAGSFVSMALQVNGLHGDRATSFYGLSEGQFATPSARLTLLEFQPDLLGPDTLGSGANHITLEGMSADHDKALVTMNGSHSVVRLDLDNWTVLRRTPTNTTGFDGPRETMALSPSTLLVSTYAGDVRRIMVSDNSVRVIPVYGKAEGMARAGSKIFVALPFAPDAAYTPSASVAVIDTATIASVRRDDAVAAATTLEQNYPNPVSSGTAIHFSVDLAGRVIIALYTPDGGFAGTIIDREMEPGSYTARIDAAGLASGSYIYTLRAGGSVLSRVMKVVR
ncbi:MAG: hypothetical protein ABI876_03465, partial [Bacteroidota bacterium]